MAREPKMQHCFNCGEELGVYIKHFRDLDTCGKSECLKAERDAYCAEDEEARWQAERDNYDRYR